MTGAIIGDIVGSRFEFNNHRSKEFDLFHPQTDFTDDTVMTLAVGNALMKWIDGGGDLAALTVSEMQRLGRAYPGRGYGGRFAGWLLEKDPKPYNSWGNGAAMRVSACGWVGQTNDEVVRLAKAVTEVTHNHPEGIKGAEAAALAVFFTRKGATQEALREFVGRNYYDLGFTIDGIRDTYRFDESSQNTVPQAIEAYLEASGFEDAIRTGVSVGGDTDTLCAITGGIAEARWGVPVEMLAEVGRKLPAELFDILAGFRERFVVGRTAVRDA